MQKLILTKSHIHFVGVGGIGMSGLAELMHKMGAKVTGSDLNLSAQVERLRSIGVDVKLSHDEMNVVGADVVVYSSAVPPSNPELVSALENKIPCIKRAEALAEIMRLKRGLAVAGTHGKTTTTALCASVFLEAGTDPTIVIGGIFDRIQSTAMLGKGEWLLAEADESDGSFNRLSPEMVIMTNIDEDHLEHFGSFDALKKAFWDFAESIPFYGSAVLCGDDENIQELFKNFPKRKFTYGFYQDNDYVLNEEKLGYSLSFMGEPLGSFTMSVPGRHNALNATGALVAGLQAGLSFDACASGVSQFTGVSRRFEFKGEKNGVEFYDDYAHHPTEIRATLEAFRQKYPIQKISVLFQPHRYSRTKACWNDFLESFSLASDVYITDIYPAGERPLEGVSGEALANALNHNSASWVGGESEVMEKMPAKIKEAEVFVTFGAGSISRWGERLFHG